MMERPWLGRVPLRRSVGAGDLIYYGEWGLADGSAGGKMGPFSSVDEAFNAAVKAARDAGAKALPKDGFAQVVDSTGKAVGPVT